MDFIDVVFTELLTPILAGYFVHGSTPQITRWKLAAWAALGCFVGAFPLINWLENPIGIGIVIGLGLCSAIASPVFSASAYVLHRKQAKGEDEL